MLHELLSIFRPGNSLSEAADEFAEMLTLTRSIAITAGQLFFCLPVAPESRARIYEDDVRINDLERKIRSRIIQHLSHTKSSASVPYCVLLTSLVKDVERLGDLSKNISELSDHYAGPLADDELLGELREIRDTVEEIFGLVHDVFAKTDREQALELIRRGRSAARRSESLIRLVAKAEHYSPGMVTNLVLGARYYKRMAGHLTNVLTSVVMPLHKIDYYDEKELGDDPEPGGRENLSPPPASRR